MSKPASVIFERKYFVLYSSLSRKAVVSLSISITAIEAPTMPGASVFEKRYGLERCRNISIISFNINLLTFRKGQKLLNKKRGVNKQPQKIINWIKNLSCM